MASAKKRATRQLVFGDRRGELGQIHIDIEAFFEFSFWLAEELEDLVSQQTMLNRMNDGGTVIRPCHPV